MAVTNAATGRPLFAAAGDAISGRVFLKHLRWVGATTAGHTLIVKDTAGGIIWKSVADGVNFIDVHPFYVIVNGIVADTMASGELQAFLG